MKASALLGAGGANDLLEVLWEDAERVFCRIWRDDAEGHRHAFIPAVLSGSEYPMPKSYQTRHQVLGALQG